MTRTSSTVTFARMSQTRRVGTGSGYPQWMRTLEEKYQKLHKKITENTGTSRFTNCVGRSVYDTRLTQALTKYKDATSERPSTFKTQTSKGSAIEDNENGEFTNEVCKETLQDQYLHNDETIHVDINYVENGESFEGNRPHSTDRSVISNISRRRELDSAKSRVSRYGKRGSVIIIDELDDDNEDNVETRVDLCADNLASEHNVENPSKDKVLSTGLTNHTGRDKIESDGDKLNVDKHNRKNLKTSVSRTSKITCKSLPAKIQSQGSKLGQKQLLAARSKSANRLTRMFTPMSEEAKHAITETIHEMNSSTPGRSTARSDVKFIPSRGRTCVKSWVLPKKSKTAYDARPLLESASKCLADFVADGGDKIIDRLSNKSDDNIDSSAESLHDGIGRNDSRLPEIRNGSARDQNIGRNKSYRIPGIGKYNITKDDPVFEITPPGFDSRYNDMPPAEERESETPPPDIRQRAIDKCSEWLVKYNK